MLRPDQACKASPYHPPPPARCARRRRPSGGRFASALGCSRSPASVPRHPSVSGGTSLTTRRDVEKLTSTQSPPARGRRRRRPLEIVPGVLDLLPTPPHRAALPPPWAPATTRAPQPTSVHRACPAPCTSAHCRPGADGSALRGEVARVRTHVPSPEYRLPKRAQSAPGPNAQRATPLPGLLRSGLWRWAKPHPPPSRPPFPLFTPQAGPRARRPTAPRPPHG